MQVQIYLKLDRLDLASKTAKNMADFDDDDALTLLVQAWVFIAQGGEKITEALYQLQELVEKFGSSVNILNLMAVCQIHQRNYAEAFGHLKAARSTALQLGGKAHPDTLINTVLVLRLLNKDPAIIAKISGFLVLLLLPPHSGLGDF